MSRLGDALEKSLSGFNALLALTLILVPRYAVSQLVATNDQTSNVAPVTSPTQEPQTSSRPYDNSDESDCITGVRDGVIVQQAPEKVQLEIVSIEPRQVYEGTAIKVTIRLTNVGDKPILVPWATSPVAPETDPKTGTKSWERVSISLAFGTREEPRRTSYLKGEANLAATPSNRTQHVELLTGQWVEVKFNTVVLCYSSKSWAVCQKLPKDGHTELTAHWGESLSTHEEEGCSEWSGHYESRTAESAPFPIEYVASSASSQKTITPRQ
jgi:hypothetical protein